MSDTTKLAPEVVELSEADSARLVDARERATTTGYPVMVHMSTGDSYRVTPWGVVYRERAALAKGTP